MQRRNQLSPRVECQDRAVSRKEHWSSTLSVSAARGPPCVKQYSKSSSAWLCLTQYSSHLHVGSKQSTPILQMRRLRPREDR